MGTRRGSKTLTQRPDLKAIRARLQEQDEKHKDAFETTRRAAELKPTTIEALKKLCWGQGEAGVPNWFVERIRVPSEIWGRTWHEVAKAWERYPGFDHLPVVPDTAGEGVKLGRDLFLFARNRDPKSVAKKLEDYRRTLGRSEDVPVYSKRKNEDTENGIWCFAKSLYDFTQKLSSHEEEKPSAVVVSKPVITPAPLPPLKEEVRFDPTDLAILKHLKKQTQRLNTLQIATQAKLNSNSIGDNLSKLRRLGLIENPGRQGYLITQKGLAYLEAQTAGSSQLRS